MTILWKKRQKEIEILGVRIKGLEDCVTSLEEKIELNEKRWELSDDFGVKAKRELLAEDLPFCTRVLYGDGLRDTCSTPYGVTIPNIGTLRDIELKGKHTMLTYNFYEGDVRITLEQYKTDILKTES